MGARGGRKSDRGVGEPEPDSDPGPGPVPVPSAGAPLTEAELVEVGLAEVGLAKTPLAGGVAGALDGFRASAATPSAALAAAIPDGPRVVASR